MGHKINQTTFDEFFNYEGMPFSELGINFKHGTLFGPMGREEEIACLEQKLDFHYPQDYLNIITCEGNTASCHFRSGWWKVLNTETAMVLWSFSLSLRCEPPLDWPREDTLAIEKKFKLAKLAGIPFGEGFLIDKQTMFFYEGWLYFNREDRSITFTDHDFVEKRPVAPDFTTMMNQADFVGYDA